MTFLTLFLILIVTRFLGELFARFGVPSVLGELFAGILLGSSVLGVIEPNEILKILAEIGIILLLFKVGIETDFTRLKKCRNKVTHRCYCRCHLTFYLWTRNGLLSF